MIETATDTPQAPSVDPGATGAVAETTAVKPRRRRRKVEPPKQNLVLYNPQGNVPLSERKTGALQLMTCREPEVVIKGPARTGKSLAAAHRVNAVLCKYAGARALMVRKTRASLTESGLVTYEGIIPRNLAVYPDTQAVKRKDRKSYEYPNGSSLVIAGMDTPERVLSTEYDLIYVQEATELSQHDWEILLSRLSNGKIPEYQQIIGDMNPTFPNHWINRRIAEGKIKMIYSRHEDNPRWWNGKSWDPEGDRYLDKLRRTTGVRYLRYFKGVDAAAEGTVHPDFDPSKHILSPQDEKNRAIIRAIRSDPNWRRLRVIDFGFRHPFVCGWFAVSPDGIMYRYREIYYSQRVVEDHAKDIKKYSYNEIYENTLADHDAEDRATLSKHGIKTKPAYKSVSLGIEAVNVRIRDDRFFVFAEGDVDGQKYGRVECDPILAEEGRPTKTTEEFDVYSYPEAKAGTAGKEDPVKEFDDGCDTNRYACCEVDDVARRRFKLRGGRVGKAA